MIGWWPALSAEPPGLAALFSPPGLLLALLWNFIVLACLQLTVRLIRVFSVKTTLLGALAQTPVFLAASALYVVWLGMRFDLYIVPATIMGITGYSVARWILRVRRTRGRVVAALGTALLASPWPVFMLTVSR
ncbi:MAG: hypothetical protein ACKVVP_05010 [Chloroflexota bacterium]